MLVRLDSGGKQTKTVHVGYPGIFGGIHLLPNGNVVVPLYSVNKVIEFDAEGKSVWEASVQLPSSAQRLANGHTLVACQNLGRVLELGTKTEVAIEPSDAVVVK